jgi:transketolase
MSAEVQTRPGEGRPNQDVFSETLQQLAGADKNIVVVTSDSRGSGKLGPFAKALPAQLVEVGIAEQNLVGIAAGLASAGKKVFAVSPACFLTARALEQIKNDVAYSDQPVKLVGISAGVSYGALGSTHHSTHDFAVLRAIHNLALVAPADNFETREVVKAALAARHPVYLRFGKLPMPHVHKDGVKFEIGRAITVRDGADAAFLANGETVIHAVRAADELAAQGIRCRVVSVHTVKPLDTAAVLDAARKCKAIVTVEEHSICGGLGEACASVLMQAGVKIPFQIVGLPDEATVNGSQPDLFRHYGISKGGLAQTAVGLLKQT